MKALNVELHCKHKGPAYLETICDFGISSSGNKIRPPNLGIKIALLRD